jgi:hypothetical protein
MVVGMVVVVLPMAMHPATPPRSLPFDGHASFGTAAKLVIPNSHEGAAEAATRAWE